jgi:hypothetical protein
VYKEPVKLPVKEAKVDRLNQSLTVNISPRLLSIGLGEEYEVIDESEFKINLPPRPICHRGIQYFSD